MIRKRHNKEVLAEFNGKRYWKSKDYFKYGEETNPMQIVKYLQERCERHDKVIYISKRGAEIAAEQNSRFKKYHAYACGKLGWHIGRDSR